MGLLSEGTTELMGELALQDLASRDYLLTCLVSSELWHKIAITGKQFTKSQPLQIFSSQIFSKQRMILLFQIQNKHHTAVPCHSLSIKNFLVLLHFVECINPLEAQLVQNCFHFIVSHKMTLLPWIDIHWRFKTDVRAAFSTGGCFVKNALLNQFSMTLSNSSNE